VPIYVNYPELRDSGASIELPLDLEELVLKTGLRVEDSAVAYWR
jgi:hypothetical protein